MPRRSTTTTTAATAWSLRGTDVVARLPSASSGHAVLHGHNLDGTSISWWEQQWPFVSWAVFLVGTGWLLRDCWNSASISPSTRYPLKGRERIQQQQQDQQQQQHRDHLWYGWLLIVAYCLHQSEGTSKYKHKHKYNMPITTPAYAYHYSRRNIVCLPPRFQSFFSRNIICPHITKHIYRTRL